MPAPRWVAKLNKVGLNKVTRFIAPRAPGGIKAPDFLRLDIVAVSGVKTMGNARFIGSE